MRPAILRLFPIVLLALLCIGTSVVLAQGITTAAIGGKIANSTGEALPGANIIAVHTPSGTTYGTSSRPNGRYNVPNLRVGGPYTVTVSFVGYKKQVREDVYLTLSQTLDLDFAMAEEAIQAAEVVITAERSSVMSASRTGAATSIGRMTLASLPSISGRLADFIRLTPEARSGASFVGQDNRLNNVTVDGSYFNNSFGLAGQPGERTGVAPISLDAIEQVQVNIAPYDVRQGNFVGAGINTVTRSGGNKFFGSAAYSIQHQGLVGSDAGTLKYTGGKFKYNRLTFSVGGPIIENKLFFFANYEGDERTEPGTTFQAATAPGITPAGNLTRVLASDLDALSSFLKTNFNYTTGPYQGYDHLTPAKRFIIKFDYNLDQRNKLTLRYNHLDSETDVLLSNSSSLGFGTRRTNLTGLNFKSSNYTILENIRSVVGEWNSTISDNMSNNLIVGYSFSDESRGDVGKLFPFIDILNAGSVYTSFGSEPFTPNNELRYSSYQLQDNFSMALENHLVTFGISAERYESENVFFPGKQSAYVYNSLADFYTDANGYLANPNRTTSPVTLRTFQVRWANIPGMEKPVQPLEVLYAGVYAQDEWQAMKGLKLTLGVRLDVPSFGETGFANANADALSFMDEKGKTVKYSTAKLPDANILFSPRFGFNWDVMGDRSTQIRGGTGVFTGRPAYVWISNQIGNTGVLTGFESKSSLVVGNDRPFNPNPDKYKPATVTGAPASSYELALTDPDFRFPQQWRTNFAVDQKLPFGLIGTAEFLYSRELNGVYYINANLATPNTAFVGADNRPRWTTSNRINAAVANAVVLKNQNEGSSWSVSASLEKPFSDGLFAKFAYNYAESKNTVDAGSIAFGSWNNNQHPGNPNNPGIGFSSNFPGHRAFASLSYRQEYFDFGATTVSMLWEGATIGNTSYTFSGDLNGDGGTSNDLIYIPKNTSEMNFEQFAVTVSGVTTTFTPQQQADAWESYIKQDKYLSSNRGKYAERGGVLLPMIFRADLGVVQEVFGDFLGKHNTLQLRLDILNVGNLINKNWGAAQRLVNAQPLIARTPLADGKALYRLRAINDKLMSTTFEQTAFITDVYRIQLGVKYFFN
ncbi:MAG: carboxypeptidase regulatory-like domain-containing protein [Ignavibacteria bacterium]|nr:carboxypeptidase regulatory-like domain-containing protein [Ignavibacteria bacterium]